MQKNQIFVLCLQEVMGGYETGRWSKTGEPVLPRPGPETATACIHQRTLL